MLNLIIINDFITDKKIDFIKIDIDGLDLLALKGCEKFLKGSPIILIEVSRYTLKYNISFFDIINYLEKFGYKPYKCQMPLQKLIYSHDSLFEDVFDGNEADDLLFMGKGKCF